MLSLIERRAVNILKDNFQLEQEKNIHSLLVITGYKK